MKSQALPSFWESYQRLPDPVKRAARKAYRLWQESPFHPSLHFKCVNQEERVWSVRLTLGYRALGIMEGDTVGFGRVVTRNTNANSDGVAMLKTTYAMLTKREGFRPMVTGTAGQRRGVMTPA